MGTTAISTLAGYVCDRIEESRTSPVFWTLQQEIYTSLVEAMNELMMLVGRPTQTVNVPFTIQPNTAWQAVPKGVFCVTGLQGPASQVYKMVLTDLDYVQACWGADWQNDVGPTIQEWAPIGFNMFVVHPVVAAPQNVLLTGIAYPTTNTWPYSGNEDVPFSDEFFQALEKYAAHYLRFKEAGSELSDSIKMLQEFMAEAQRNSAIQDRRDPFIFNRPIGTQTQVNPITKR